MQSWDLYQPIVHVSWIGGSLSIEMWVDFFYQIMLSPYGNTK